MGLISTIMKFLLGLVGIGDKVVTADIKNKDQETGQKLQQGADLKAGADIAQKQAQAGADAPASRKELEAKLGKGEA